MVIIGKASGSKHVGRWVSLITMKWKVDRAQCRGQKALCSKSSGSPEYNETVTGSK